MQKKLPIGIQHFPKLIEDGFLYVDKTEYYHRLLTTGDYYFLARPRRFGKSLLISTLAAILEGRRELFEGLWIHDKIAWEPTPVIHLDFTQMSKRAATFDEGLRLGLRDIANKHGVELTEDSNPGRFLQLIHLLSKEKKVAILVDEYDKPLVDNIEDPTVLDENRQILKSFYSVLKGNDDRISFLMLTGVTKFSQVSIFSDLNHLYDLTVDPHFAQMVGYTHEEIVQNFPAQLQALKSRLESTERDAMAELRNWYNGYSWDGVHFVYNPFSILNFFAMGRFGEYWFATGTPTFLMKLIRARGFGAYDVEGVEVPMQLLQKFDVPQMDLHALLFQTGYLTIKKIDDFSQAVTLDFPNREVRIAFSAYLLAEFSEKGNEGSIMMVLEMARHLRIGAVEAFLNRLQSLFSGISYPIHPGGLSGVENHEKYYHTMFHLVLRLLGYDIHSEVLTHDGRIDAVVTTAEYIYVTEFKLGDAATAMAQLKRKNYHVQYLGTGKKVILLAIGFDVATRNVGGFLVEEV